MAVPVAWQFGVGLLDNFAYRVQFNWGWIIFAVMLLLVITFVSTISQTLRVVVSNPSKTLKEDG